MKKKTLFYTTCILLALTAMGITMWSNMPGRVAVTSLLAAVIITFVLLLANAWLGFLKRITSQLDVLADDINSESAAKYKGSDRLEFIIPLVKKKQALTAAYIMQLNQSESQGTMDDLIRKDKIGEALIRVRKDMQELKKREEQQNWIANGLALFNEILRNKLEIRQYGQQIVSNLVKYLGANQGGMYLEYTDEDRRRYLELIACYAYNKKKYVEDRVYEGNGLLGQNMMEKDLVFMTDIPNDYIKITSGLGEALPRNLVIAPLIFKEKYYGVIELAFFKILEPYQVEFLKSISEDIASEIASIQTFQHTEHLLTESHQLTQELKLREEEMRQNLEELATTQEEMTRKQNELNSYLQAIDNTIASVEFDINGKLVTANEIFLTVMGYSSDELVKYDYKDLMVADASVEMMWSNLQAGQFFSGEFKMKSKKGMEMWLSGTFNPVTKGGKSQDRIMMYAQFTTQEKERMNDLGAMVNALKSTLPVVELSEEFFCKTANEKFLKLFQLSRVELRNKALSNLVAPYYRDLFERLTDEILSKEFSTILLPFPYSNKTITYECTVSVTRNLVGKISRIILILVKEVEIQISMLAAI